jgi:hypothetical protein
MGQWTKAGIVTISKPEQGKRQKLAYTFKRNVVKVLATSASTRGKVVKPTWVRAGYLYQMDGIDELSEKPIPLFREVVIELGKLYPSQAGYTLQFKAQGYLPNLKITVWEDASYLSTDIPIVRCVGEIQEPTWE